MANETIGGIKRLGEQVGGDDRWDVNITGGNVDNVTIDNATITDSTIALSTPLAPSSGGTGVANSSTITVAGNLTHAGAFTQTFTATANTALTLPTTGTLATTAQLPPFTFASASNSAYLDFAENTTNGTNRARLLASTALAADVDVFLPTASGTLATLAGTETLTNKTIPDITGTSTNDNASAGKIGEILSSNVASGSAVSLTTNTAANVTSLALTAGDWDVDASIIYTIGATTTLTDLTGGISATSATLPTPGIGAGYYQDRYSGFAPGSSSVAKNMATTRISIASPTTYYLVARGTFGVSTLSAYGWIKARRAR